jgi:hypothetical protein
MLSLIIFRVRVLHQIGGKIFVRLRILWRVKNGSRSLFGED